jgi:hypothetical protein
VVAVVAAVAEPLVLDHSAKQLWGLAAAEVVGAGAGVRVAEVVTEVQQTKKNVRITYHKQ